MGRYGERGALRIPGSGPPQWEWGQVYFLSTYEYVVDDRGRVAVPARYRDTLGPSVILSKGPDGCLEVYSPAEFQKKAERLLNGAAAQQKDRRLGRAFFGGSAEVDIDKQGRILIPASFRQWAEISGPVVIAGQGTFLEVWSAGRWQPEGQAAEDDFARALESMEARS